MSPIPKMSAVAVALALGLLVSGCEFETFKGSSSSAPPVADDGNGNGGDDNGNGNGNGSDPLPEPPVTGALFDAEGLFLAAAPTAQANDVEILLAGIPIGATEAFEEVNNAISDYISNYRPVVPVGLELSGIGPGAHPCYNGQGTFELPYGHESDREGEWGDPIVRRFGSSFQRQVFVHCAIPLYDRVPEDNGNGNGNDDGDGSNGADVVIPIEGIEASGLLLAPAPPPPVLILNGFTQRDIQWDSLYHDEATKSTGSDVQTMTFVAQLRGEFEGRENAFVFDGEASMTMENEYYNEHGIPDYWGENQHRIEVPRFEVHWAPTPEDVRYLGRIDLEFNHAHSYEHTGGVETFEWRSDWNGRAASHTLNGFFEVSTPKTVTSEVIHFFEPYLAPAGRWVVPCPHSGILQINDAELRFGEDTGVSGSDTQIVSGSGESRNHVGCDVYDHALDPLLDDLNMMLGE